MKSIRLFSSVILILILLVITTGMRPLAPMADISVNTFSDEYDSEVYPAGHCSLREAITAANTAAAFGGCPAGAMGADIIQLPAGHYLLTRSGPVEILNEFGDLNPGTDMQLVGTGSVIIDAGGDTGIGDRVIENDWAALTLNNLTITGGRAPAGAIDAWGGEGGGIRNVGSLTLINVTITDNRAGDGSIGGRGGGIYSISTLSIQDSVISNNRAGDGLIGTTNNGVGGSGGGIYFEGNSLSITNSSITGNIAGAGTPGKSGAMGGDGGGIFLANSLDNNITGTTISGNIAGSSSGSSGGQGGGIYNEKPLFLENSTISGNTSGSSTSELHSGGYGGGIAAYGAIVFHYSTIYDNHIGSGPSGDGLGGGIFSVSAYITLGSSILAGNLDSGGYASDCYSNGDVTSEDYNLIGSVTGCTFSGSISQSFMGMPGFALSPLGNYGGLTQTHRLTAGSLVIDQIPMGTNGCGSEPDNIDQRGWVRPVDGNGSGTAECDMGSFEYSADATFLPLIIKAP
jgi:CSLREA domain-containing protein